jgi:hypothetical protein
MLDIFSDRVSRTICLALNCCPPDLCLLLAASQVPKITSVSHWHLSSAFFETRSNYVAQTGLKLLILLLQPPSAGITQCATTPDSALSVLVITIDPFFFFFLIIECHLFKAQKI